MTTDDGRASSLGSGKLGVLAAVLLCQAGTPVSPRALADALWGPSAPYRSIDGLRVYVYQLRRMLGPSRISRRPSGYELALRAGELDADRFRQLNDRARGMAARGDLPAARDRLQAALDLWRGPAFAGLQDADVVRTQAAALDELRLDAEEELAAIEMDLGRHGELCARLRTLATEHPFREGIRGQLMLALYRSGRQAEALAVFAETRQLLARELGIDPGAQLCELHEQLLRSDPSLLRPAGGGPIEISRRPAPGPPAPPAPRQLPPDTEDFTGRTDELAELAGTPGAARASGLVVISGAAGIGKTALAVHAAHRLAGLFPDGQLYLDLRGHHQRAPVHPLDALAQWLRALGIPAERTPTDLAEATAVFRSLVAGRRMLVLLDNAGSAEQVRPLLPGGNACLVLVTSRNQLAGLVATHGAQRLSLAVLTPVDSRTLLARIIGADRAAAEPAAATALVRCCGYLPLALRVAAANLAGRPEQGIADYLHELQAGDPLTALRVDGDDGGSVRSALELSYTPLEPDARRLFRWLAVLPGATFTVPAAAAVLDVADSRARSLVRALRAAHLVECWSGERYGFHDLLRHYAVERALAEDDEAALRSATARWYRWQLTMVDAAAQLLYPLAVRLPLTEDATGAGGDVAATAAGPGPARFGGPAEALSWLDDERDNLVSTIGHAAAEGDPQYAAPLAVALRGYLQDRGFVAEWLG